MVYQAVGNTETLPGVRALLSSGDLLWHLGGFSLRPCCVYLFISTNQVFIIRKSNDYQRILKKHSKAGYLSCLLRKEKAVVSHIDIKYYCS